jgi:hypothetical protein
MSIPYYEWLLKAIKKASFVGFHDLASIAREVTILVGHHDEILSAWNERKCALHVMDDLGVPAAILKQKKEVEEEAEKKTTE